MNMILSIICVVVGALVVMYLALVAGALFITLEAGIGKTIIKSIMNIVNAIKKCIRKT